VEIQARALGLDLASPLTATGGMRFAGGPWNSYALHMVANVVERVRQSDGGWAVVSGNGGLASRFSLGAFAGEPSKGGLVKISQPFLPAPDDCCTLDQQPQGEARIEAFSVAHDRTRQPREAFVACRTDAGARAWARVEDGEALKALMSLDCPGATMRFSTDGAELQV
jgi:acetyl-CoA C-acetyltransferase